MPLDFERLRDADLDFFFDVDLDLRRDDRVDFDADRFDVGDLLRLAEFLCSVLFLDLFRVFRFCDVLAERRLFSFVLLLSLTFGSGASDMAASSTSEAGS